MTKPALVGCELPRIFTPALPDPITGLPRELTPLNSDGFACIRFAEEVLGITLFDWQKWLLIHALELRDEDRLYRFRTVIVLVARQNGKTLIMIVLALWHIYIRGSRTVIATAQDLTNAEKAWAEAVAMAEENDDLADQIAHVVKTNGKKALVLHEDVDEDERRRSSVDDGPTYRVAAASRRGARGFSGDLVLLDELREHQSWDAWGASTKTTLARPKAQVWGFSNAGDALSIVLRYLRAIAHEALGWPDGDDDKVALAGNDDLDDEDMQDGDSLGLFEWSAPPDAPRNDRRAWAQANPSLPHTISERAIASAMRTDPQHVFLTEVLCRWVTTADGGPFPEGKWALCRDNASKIAADSRKVLAIDMSWNRSMTYVGLAGFREDGTPHVEIQQARAGSDWVIPWITERIDIIAGVALQESGAPVSSMLPDLEAIEGLNVIKCAGADLGRACGTAFDRVDQTAVRFTDHPGLNMAASTAVAKYTPGGAFVIDRKTSPNDAAPLVAWIEALWALLNLPVELRSAYEDNEVMSV